MKCRGKRFSIAEKILPLGQRTCMGEEVLVLGLGGLDPLIVDDQVVGNHQLIVRII